MNAITQTIVNYSTLEVTMIKITNATRDTFLMSMESQVANTGPVGATLSPMTVDMCGVAGVFGRLDLPEIKTKSSGTTVSVKDQKIDIVDMNAFIAFNKSIMQEETLILRLENGKSKLRAMMMTSSIVYAKDVTLKGMNGPKTGISKTELEGNGFKNTISCVNPSPLEIDLGTVKQEIKNSKGEKIAEQQGHVYMSRGEFTYTMTGTVTGVASEGEATVSGLGVVEDTWTNQTIVNFSTSLTLTEEFVTLCKGA